MSYSLDDDLLNTLPSPTVNHSTLPNCNSHVTQQGEKTEIDVYWMVKPKLAKQSTYAVIPTATQVQFSKICQKIYMYINTKKSQKPDPSDSSRHWLHNRGENAKAIMHFGHEYVQMNVNLMNPDYAEHISNMWSMKDGDKEEYTLVYKDEFSFSFQLEINTPSASTIMYTPDEIGVLDE